MGWFSGSSNDDSVKKMDPGLREYLESEGPKQYVPAQVEEPQPPKPAETVEAEPSTPPVPSKSLFPDGRYAHLWKTYKPPADEDGPQLKGAEQISAEYKSRNKTIKHAASENCAFEHEDLLLCTEKGNWSEWFYSRATMCSDAQRTFNRCFTTQVKFLRALGYASGVEWDDERQEQIQMHADKLYHEMLDYEKRVEEARAAGRDAPPLTSLFNPQAKPEPIVDDPAQVQIPGGEPIPENFRPSKPIERLSPHQRELEIRVHHAKLEQMRSYREEKTRIEKVQDDAREKRREKAVSWFGETVGKWIT
ncbi:hypothetical protein BJX99DRAFT_259666 [Aspergillus californicus]